MLQLLKTQVKFPCLAFQKRNKTSSGSTGSSIQKKTQDTREDTRGRGSPSTNQSITITSTYVMTTGRRYAMFSSLVRLHNCSVKPKLTGSNVYSLSNKSGSLCMCVCVCACVRVCVWSVFEISLPHVKDNSGAK